MKLNKLGKAGAIVAIVGASFGIFMTTIFSLIFGASSAIGGTSTLLIVYLALLAFDILTVIFNARALNGNGKTLAVVFSFVAAVLSIFALSITGMILLIIGGILLACGRIV